MELEAKMVEKEVYNADMRKIWIKIRKIIDIFR